MPEKKICYLLPLEKELPTPAKLASDMEKAGKIVNREVITANKWTAGQKLTDRSILSDEMADFCAGYPIHDVKHAEDTMSLSNIQSNGRKTRKRRFVSLDEVTCNGGIAHPFDTGDAESCYLEGKIWRVKCRITTSTCYKIVVCPTFDDCYQRHLTNRVFCPEYVCEKHPSVVGELVQQ